MATPTSARNWRKRTGGIELELPSGNVCKVKRPGMQKLLEANMLPDSLTPIAMEHIRAAESGGRPTKGKDSDLEAEIMDRVMSDPAQMTEIFRSFDKAVAMCVVEPKVQLHFRDVRNPDGTPRKDADGVPEIEEIPEDERDEDVLYTDEIDEDDKQFIFQFVVGGSSDLDRFRKEQAAAVEGARAGEDVPGSTE